MRKTFLIPVILFSLFIAASCKDDGKGRPNDYMNNRDKDHNRNKDDKKDDLPDDYGMDRDHPDRRSLIGTWSVRDFKSTDGEELTASEKAEMGASTVEFVGNGTYITTTREHERTDTEKGTYTYDSQSKRLITVSDKTGEKEVLEVEFDGKDWVTMTSDKGMIKLERY